MEHRKDKKEKSAERKRNRKKHKRDHDTATAAARKVRCHGRGGRKVRCRGRGTACEWTDKASEIFRKNPKWAKKFLVMRKLTDMVMGDKFLAQPLRHPAAPLGPAARTAFWDEWELQALTALLALAAYAANNPAAKQLEARWRQAIKMKGTSRSSSSTSGSAPHARLTGDTEEGYEPLRTPPATPDETEPTIVFPHSFEVGSAELREWLAGSGI